ncbi:hypothetical protein [Mangrovihabitans endophyticus]|uniref:PH domain-containing protein n=1 Tax=Mangrovihabitans endophyticus TaxID=1751298 RepID=A0A8J3C818_9ACTN|nr:hypothetical protein [Mangrovihabitans endophyticus]GGL18915.1 hypothetical protein GCM10012284_61840 [Mangrovihabitans endophyticus]
MLPNPEDPPAGWPKARRSALRVLAAAGFAVLTVITAAVAVSAVAAGDVAGAITFGMGAIVLAHLTGMSVNIMQRPRPADHPPVTDVNDHGETGLAFRYAFWPYYWLSVVFAFFTLGAAAFAIVVAMQATWAAGVLAALALAAAALVGWYLVVLLRLAPGRVVLTRSGLYHRSLFLEHFVPWDAVVDVVARAAPSPWITVKALPMDQTRERRHTGRMGGFEGQALPFMVVRTQWLGADALPAYQAIKYYFAHPEQRTHLTDHDLRTNSDA